jgi:ATP-dependent protease ClpP protease subunit
MIKNIFNEEELLTDTDNTSTDEDKEKLIYKRQTTTNKYYFHLDEEISSPEKYRSMCIILREAQDNDEIHLVINTPGGDIASFILHS